MVGLNLSVFDHGLNTLMMMPNINGFSFLPKWPTSGLCLQINKKPLKLLHSRHGSRTKHGLCVQNQSLEVEGTLRRSANYHPTIWEHSFLESIRSPYTDVAFNKRIGELKHEVKVMLEKSKEPSHKLRLIDSITRLGVAYQLEDEIEKELNRVYLNGFDSLGNLHGTALCFRLLRQHGYSVSTDVFQKFKEEDGRFKACLGQDAKGLLSLYEASYLAFPGEEILDEAKEFSVGHLNHLKEISMDMELLAKQVGHSLEMPLHWRVPRVEARYYVDVYEREEGGSSVLLELAKLDFNVTQAMHQEEIKELSRWWRNLGLSERTKFARDRMLENYFMAVAMTTPVHQFSKYREIVTKFSSIACVIDDTYDLHGSLEEINFLTSWANSFTLDVMENQPHILKLTLLAAHNLINDIAYHFFKDHSWDATSFIKEKLKGYFDANSKEAEWFNKGYTPTLDEYLENSWLTTGGDVLLGYAYLLSDNGLTRDSLRRLDMVNGPIYWSSMICRLKDDLGTYKDEMKRGDTPKSIQCHMNAFGVSEETSRECIEGLLRSDWKELNRESLTSSLPRSFINVAINMARVAHFFYQNGDGYGTPTGETKSQITSLFINSIPMNKWSPT